MFYLLIGELLFHVTGFLIAIIVDLTQKVREKLKKKKEDAENCKEDKLQVKGAHELSKNIESSKLKNTDKMPSSTNSTMLGILGRGDDDDLKYKFR